MKNMGGRAVWLRWYFVENQPQFDQKFFALACLVCFAPSERKPKSKWSEVLTKAEVKIFVALLAKKGSGPGLPQNPSRFKPRG